MRSRDGSYTLLLSICTIILLSTILNAKEYYISYRYVIKNAVLYNESFGLSKAMQPCIGQKDSKNSITLLNSSKKNLKEFLSDTSGEFIDYIHKLGLDVKNQTIQTNMQNSSITILTLKTMCFNIEINENYIKITPIIK